MIDLKDGVADPYNAILSRANPTPTVRPNGINPAVWSAHDSLV
jgi:hypothetical protein